MTKSEFSELGLHEPLLRALNALKHNQPTPIQSQAMPQLLAGKDLLGVAQTGTGKTAAFGLPILQMLAESSTGRAAPRAPRALILAPTPELAIQIGQALEGYGRHLPLRHAVIYGGVSQKAQVTSLRRGLDILIATPGRLLDLMGQRQLQLSGVEHFVLDEADRMLDMGFIRDVRRIVAALPQKRQTLLFSATMPKAIAGLAGDILSDPVRVAVTPAATPVERIEQSVCFVDAARKRALLAEILQDPKLNRTIVFTRTKHRANRVADQLERNGIAAEAIHGNKSQGARQRALEGFRRGRVRVLVATDIAARGIDVEGVSHVINYELPNVPEDYVHRIGRTARAGASGTAISLCDPSEQGFLRGIESLTKHRLKVLSGEPANVSRAPSGSNRNRSAQGGNRNRKAEGGKQAGRSDGRPGRRRRNRPPRRAA